MKPPRFLRRVLPTGGHDEAGFTLAELIISLLIETVIFGALAAAFVVVINGGTSVNENLRRSSDARVAAAYLVSDARNSSGPQLSLTDITSCPDASPPVTGTQTAVARFAWNAPSSDGTTTTTNISNYVVVGTNLLRRHCEAGALVDDQVIASNVSGVTVSCSANADCSGNPTSIAVVVTATIDAQSAAAGSPAYTYTLTAAFRQSSGGPLPSNAPAAPVILLGGPCSSGTAGLSVTGAATMRVYGDTYVNTADGSTCTAMKLANSGTYQSATTSFFTGGTCVALSGLVCPPSSTYSPAFTDPYASLVPPSPTGRPAQTGCTGPSSSETAQPGVYANAFSTGPSGAATCTLASGVYIMQAGFHIGNGVTLNTAAGGVLIYMTGGQFSVDGGANMTLTASTTGQWANIVFWQAAVDTTVITMSNGGVIKLNGTLYGPKTQLKISGGAQAPVITAVVVQTILLSNSGALVVGSASPTPLSIGSATPPSTWTVNHPYPNTTLVANGGDGQPRWSASGMPVGMSLNATTGVISGTPTVVASGSATVTLNDANGDDPAAQSFTLNIVAGPTISTVSLPAWTVNRPYLAQLNATGGTTPYTWTASANLPAGLSLNLLTGAVSGTPTAVAAPTVSITATDAAGATAVNPYPLTINAAPTISTTTLPGGSQNASYTTSLTGSGGTSPLAWSASGLPAGLTLGTGTNVISGTPTTTGTFSVTITLTDAAGATTSSSLSLLVRPTITSVTLANGGATAGKVEKGDTISIVYSAPMSVASFCSAWSNDLNNQSLTADNVVTVTLGDATTDTVTVTSTTCTFNLGTIDLGSNGYVSGGAALFKGTGTNHSTIAWTASTHTLVITFGAVASGGTVGRVTTSPVTYTASTSIKDSTGNTLANSPLVLATATRF